MDQLEREFYQLEGRLKALEDRTERNEASITQGFKALSDKLDGIVSSVDTLRLENARVRGGAHALMLIGSISAALITISLSLWRYFAGHAH